MIKTHFLFLSQQLMRPTVISISWDQFSFSKRGQSSNLSPYTSKLIFISKGFALRLSFKTEAPVNSNMAKIPYRYCKSQTIAVCKGISILIIQLKEQTEPLKKKIINTTKVLLYITCAVNSIPRIPWLAGAHKGSFSV